MPAVWRGSLIASRLLQILVSRLQAHTRLDEDGLVVKRQYYQSRKYF